MRRRAEAGATTAARSGTISAVVVTHNSETELVALIESVVRDERICDLVIVDNASSDGTRAVLAEAQAAHGPWIQSVLRDTASGFAAANNAGVAASRGEVVAILNPDLVLVAGFGESILDELASQPDAMVAPILLNEDGSRQASVRLLPRRRDLLMAKAGPATQPDPGSLVEQPSGAAMVMHRSTWDRLGGMSEDYPLYYEDVDICLRARRSGVPIIYAGAAKAVHYGGRSSSGSRGQAFAWARYGRTHYARTAYGPVLATAVVASTMAEVLVRWGLAVVTDRFASPRWSDARSYMRALRLAVAGWSAHNAP